MAINLFSSTSGYAPGGVAPGPVPALDDTPEAQTGVWPLSKCVQAYTTYIDSKRLEIQEQQQARRYRHGSHWTTEQVRVLNDRKQPVITYNRIGRKIDGVVGLVERLRQDPKAYPRTPMHQQGADLATAVLRYLTDRNRWEQKTPLVSEAAAIDGLAGIELGLAALPPSQTPNPLMPAQPDYDITFEVVDNDGFFYDPRSVKHDFADALYMGVGKWIDEDLLTQIAPQVGVDVGSSALSQGSELTSSSDRDNRWFYNTGGFKRVRLVDIWYKHRGFWMWALFTGSKKLMEGVSPFYDEYGRSACKYLMWSAQVDHDGDRYGFPRNLQGAQDEVNMRRSKALHELTSRRIRAVKAAIADNNIEALRREAARADGVVLSNTTLDDIQFDDQAKQAALMGQLQFLQEAKNEIENFGPNPALVGSAGVSGNSGRAIALMQQAGIAELGPYMLNMRAWKLRVYRALFNAAQRYWTQQRWIRVTDSQGLAQFIQINSMAVDPRSGMPTMQNAIGALDVDIILDEGPDTVTMMADTYDAVSQALPSVARILNPNQAQAVMDVLVESSPLPAEVKKRFRDASQAPTGPPPEMQKEMMRAQTDQQRNAGQLQLQREQAALNARTKWQDHQADIAIANNKAQNEMAIERYKALSMAQLERDKAAHQARMGLVVVQGGRGAGGNGGQFGH